MTRTLILLALVIIFAAACDAPIDPAQSVGDESPGVWFEERAGSAGVDFHHASGHDGEQFLFPEIMGGGVAIFDADDDGLMDLYFVNSGTLHGANAGPDSVNRLYRNRGDGSFEDITDRAGDAGHAGYGMGVSTGDFDNDGDVDLYVTNVGPNALLRNDGDGRFVEIAVAAGVADDGWGTSCAFVDVDVDGDLDLYVCNYVAWSRAREFICYSRTGQVDYCSPQSFQAPQPDVLYENIGDGTFADVSAESGLRTAFGTGLGVVWGDFSGDGLPDVFVANDGIANQYWVNQGPGRGFTDESVVAGCAVDRDGRAKAGMGVLAGDIDDDDDLDLLVVNLQAQSDSLFRNEAGAYFEDVAPRVGLGAVSRPFTRFGVGWFDFDLDGQLDIYQANGGVNLSDRTGADDPYAEQNLLLRGVAGGRYERVGPNGGTGRPLVATSRGAAFGDLDDDGLIDVVVVNRDGPAHVLYNVTEPQGHWIRFDVRNEHGAPALGASVVVSAGGRTIRREVQAASSYCSANDTRAHFGLGDVTEVTGATVRWPDGRVEELDGPFAVDAQHEVRRQSE